VADDRRRGATHGGTRYMVIATLARMRVALGFVFGVLVLVLAQPTRQSLLIGMSIAAGGEAIRIWAAGHLRKSREVTVSGKRQVLTHFEFELLSTLARAAGRVLSREHLMDTLRGEAFETFDRSIDVHISKLRAKIEDDPKSPRYIKTVRGVGYVLAKDA